jgi:hypothetical protein
MKPLILIRKINVNKTIELKNLLINLKHETINLDS